MSFVIIGLALIMMVVQYKRHVDEESVPVPGGEFEQALEAQDAAVDQYKADVREREAQWKRDDQARESFKSSREHRYLMKIFEAPGVTRPQFDRMPEFSEAELDRNCPTVKKNLELFRSLPEGELATIDRTRNLDLYGQTPKTSEDQAFLIEANEWFFSKYCWRY